ncbi:MAG: hypothetical protein WCS37_00405 [Chloroflexota bacterium]|nr:hypothetical protein [Chloroflexota bacterium]
MSSPWVKKLDRGHSDRLVKMAIQDLAEQVGLSPDSDAIKLVSVTPVTWPDASLGYTRLTGRKVVAGYVPGFQIILNYGNKDYDYHSGFGRVVCVPPGKGQPPLPADTL